MQTLELGDCSSNCCMGAAANHMAHDQSHKAHRNRINKRQKHRNSSTKGMENLTKGMDPKFSRNQRGDMDGSGRETEGCATPRGHLRRWGDLWEEDTLGVERDKGWATRAAPVAADLCHKCLGIGHWKEECREGWRCRSCWALGHTMSSCPMTCELHKSRAIAGQICEEKKMVPWRSLKDAVRKALQPQENDSGGSSRNKTEQGGKQHDEEMETLLDLNDDITDGFRDTSCSVSTQWIPGKGTIRRESEPAMVRLSSSRTYSLGDTVLGVSNEISCRVECENSTHIDNQLKTVKTEPLVGYGDNRSPEENSPIYKQPAGSEKVANTGSQCGSIITECLVTSSSKQEHTRVLDTTLQGNHVSIGGLDTTLRENQEGTGLGTTLKGNQGSNGSDSQFSTSEIESRIIGKKHVCWNSDSHSGSISSPALTAAVKNEPIEENCNGSEDNFNKSTHLSFLPEYATLKSATSVSSNESGSSTCGFAKLQYAFGYLGTCPPTLNLPALEKKSSVSRTLLATPSGKAESLGTILLTAENLNSLESPTSIRKVKSEPYEPAIEPFEENSSESSTFFRKATTEPFEPAVEPFENRENNVSHLDTLRANIKMEEFIEYPLDHISLKVRIDKLLVRQPYSFFQCTAENLNFTKLPTFITDAKTEPFEPTIEMSENRKCNIYNLDLLRVDVKSEKTDEFPLDVIDHILLKDRLNMLLIRQGFSFDYPTISKDSTTGVTATKVVSGSVRRRKRKRTATESVATTLGEEMVTSSAHRRKKKRTATDSVETALGEDAPELLQALVDQGINIEELKLYEVMDGDDDLIDISDIDDNFTELGNVITKLFFERSNSLLKPNSSRDMDGLKASYSLSCLISLIQQAQYLQLRKCPVEWGWCRDLQSFIFVFEKHNRIVLERPEYGYATYFFELVESFPIDWQVKRLVIAMKLTNCSRIALIENKSLMVGQDLTEGEARVLQDYGWRPHTGLASMLNFCDRVVHDRRTEMSLSEWKSKIGKLLMYGYDSGRTVIQDLPKKVMQYIEKQNAHSKMETGTFQDGDWGSGFYSS